jgi:ribosomal protein S12 methylthiotransferase accessory factor
VLQVSNGKGLVWEEARQGALLEAAELFAAEHPPVERLRFGTARQLAPLPALRPTLPLDDQLAEPRLYGPEVPLAWIDGTDLITGTPLWVPAAAVFCPAANGPWLGPAAHRWTSNGMGAHEDREAAIRHALLEALERDGLARALPEGWTPDALRRTRLGEPILHRLPSVAPLLPRLRAARLTPYLFGLDPGPGWPPLALCGALLLDDEEGPIPATAGYACAPTLDEAARSALLESAQSRLTDVHGAREDVGPPDREASLELARACRSLPGQSHRPHPASRFRPASLRQLVQQVARAGLSPIAAVELPVPGTRITVAKVLATGLLLSSLL